MEQEKVHVRLLTVAGVALFWMAAIFGRVAYLQLFRHSEYLARAAKQQRKRIDIAPKRGVIYDRNLRPLAMSIPVQSAFAVPSEVKDVGMATRLLAGVLGIPAEEIRQELESENTFVWIKRKLAPDKVEAVQSLNLKGIYLQEENQRYYPKRDMAAHVLGFVNIDEKGMGGIEERYDDLIRSKAEKVVVMTDGRQRWYDGGETLRDRGANAVLTLDERIQYIAERELAAAIEKTHAPAGSVIVQDPNSGAILAMANWPRFNPNAATNSPDEARMNRAISAIYEPGSTFKLITLAAAFDQGLIRAEEVFDCENGAVTVAGQPVRAGQIAWSEPTPWTDRSFIRLETGDRDRPSVVMACGGRPIGQPVVMGGPFVMNTQEEIVQAFRDFEAGTFGDIPRLARVTGIEGGSR